MFGIKPENIFIDDLREEFVRDFVFPMFRANTIYEGEYLLGTSIARPLIAKRQIEIARATGAEAVSHGATGKGNDQVRFEFGYYALMPGVKVIAPWREWDLLSREKLLAYAEQHGIPIEMKHKQGGRPTRWTPTCCTSPSRAATSRTPLPKPRNRCGADGVARRPRRTPPNIVDLDFEKGDLVAINGTRMKPHELLAKLERARRQARHRPPRPGRKPLRRHEEPRLLRDPGRHHPAASPSRASNRSRSTARCPPQGRLMPRYASMIYNGYWWSPERLALQALIDTRSRACDRLGARQALQGQRHRHRPGRDSKTDSLFDPTIATFEDDAGAYDQKDAHGFIRLNALRMRIAANAKAKRG